MHRRMQYYCCSMAVMMATGYLNFSQEEVSTGLTEYYRIMLSYYIYDVLPKFRDELKQL